MITRHADHLRELPSLNYPQDNDPYKFFDHDSVHCESSAVPPPAQQSDTWQLPIAWKTYPRRERRPVERLMHFQI